MRSSFYARRCPAVVLTLVALFGIERRASASREPVLTVSPSVDLLDGQIVQVSITDGPPLQVASLATCVASDAGLRCSGSAREVRILPSGAFGPALEKVRAVFDTREGSVDCRVRAHDAPCVLALRVGDEAVALAVLRFRETGPLEAEPSLALAEEEPLHDGDTVRVSGRGFDVSMHTGVRQCRAGTLDPSACRPSGRPPITSETGSLRQDVVVFAGFGTVEDEWVDCTQPPACELVVFGGRRDGALARVPLTFHADAALAAPSIEVEPSRALHDGEEVTIRGRGFSPYATVSLEQYLVRREDGESWRQVVSSRIVSASAMGTFDARMTVLSGTLDGTGPCRSGSTCTLAAREMQGRYGVALATIELR